MPTPSNTDRFVWCDTETFGLDPDKDPIIELGFVITDRKLHTIDDYSVLVWDTPFFDECFHRCPDFVRDMHAKSGLWDAAMQMGLSLADAGLSVQDWLAGHGVSPADPLCGSSVHFDRSMLQSWMPTAAAMFSYRNLDVSSIKESCMREAPTAYARLAGETEQKKLHRVLPDIEDTINEYAWYRFNYLRLEN